MLSAELRRKFLDFFKSRGHSVVPSSSLIPDDPSVLLTTAGMQQFKPYFLGKADPMKDFGSRRTTSIQKSFRTSDIDEVGDESHLTFFEMLGHFSFGDYFKKETISWTYEFLTDILKISKDRISATVFAGDEFIPFDKESHEAWSKFLSIEKIRKEPRADNVWGPAGPEGPCGAANEVYVDNLEVATLVFMEYNAAKDGNLTPLPQKGVDVGWGLERIVMIVQNKKNIFETDLFLPIISILPEGMDIRRKRVIADHIRASSFLISDGVLPSNKEAGYTLRRLLRRVISYGLNLEEELFIKVVANYNHIYPELNLEKIITAFKEEKARFEKTWSKGLQELKKLGAADAKAAFKLYESYGLPFEVIKEYSKDLTREAFEAEFKKHQEISRAGAAGKFGGHGLLLDTGELKAKDEEELKKVTRLHTATHLLQAALRKVLGNEVKQMGSDITAERTRFDFSFPRKLTSEEIKKVEDEVNGAISEKLEVKMQEMDIEDAKKSGALYFFKEKYPERVKVYTVGDPSAGSGPPFSRELCGGPHVKNTSEVGKFVIVKEEASASGVRRIRAKVIP